MLKNYGSTASDFLKLASRDLVEACGGITRAFTKTHTSQSRLSEAVSKHLPDRWMTIATVADLEADCAEPIVSRHLAQLLGFDLVPRAAASSPPAMLNLLAEIVFKTSEVNAQLATALADGHVDAAEIASLIAVTRASIIKHHELEAALAGPRQTQQRGA